LGEADLAKDIEEIFVVRDAIVHNHIWEAQVNAQNMRLVSACLPGWYGDSKFSSVVDQSTRQTRRLHLDVFPTRIHKGTAATVLRKVAQGLRLLEEQDTRYVHLLPQCVSVEKRDVPFYEWVEEL